jgi:general secretion pathway protein G
MRKAFTLIELMLVVIIIGVLASLVVPRLAGRAEKARRVAAKADVAANIPSALDLYEMDMGEYPPRLEDLIQSPGSENWDGPYLKKLPKDPWGAEYYYKYPGDHALDYDLASKGKDRTLGTEDDVTNWE